MFTILKGLEIFFKPSTPRKYLSYFDNLTCFGDTVRLYTPNSYLIIPEMESVVRNLGARSYDTRSISL